MTSFQPIAFVTGSGAPRVGRQIASHLAALGYGLAIHANTSVRGAEELAAELHASHPHSPLPFVVVGDLSDATNAQSLVQQVVEQFGRLDVLVNSAAIWHPTPLEEVTVAEVRQYFEINATSSFIAAQTAGLQMVQQPQGGSIINIGDWAVVRPYLNHAAYFPSKGAVAAMTRSLAVEFGHRNPRVRVNCILPGPVLLSDDLSDEQRAAVANSTLVRRVGSPHHVAHAVQFLIENDFVTGVCLPVDGGRSIFAEDKLQTEFCTG